MNGGGSKALHPDWSKAQATGDKFVVSTQSERASQAGKLMIEQGGNIIDAFAATSFVLAVEEPYATGIGGGGFLLFRHAATGKVVAYDFREQAPAKAGDKLFLKADGSVDAERSKTGAHAAGVPGLVAGILEIHNLYGRLSREKVIKPAIELAESGFKVSSGFAYTLKESKDRLSKYRGSRDLFFKNGEVLKEGDLFQQKDLAETLRTISKKGRDGFYKGKIAWATVMYLHKNDGLHTISDFVRYRPKKRDPIKGTYNGYTVYGMPPPSSGGILVQQILNTLEGARLGNGMPFDVDNVHKTTIAMQTAFADRGKYFGDADFIDFPQAKLLSEDWAAEHRKLLDSKRALSADEISTAKGFPKEPDHTVHFSMADQEGNVLASTQTINGWYGNAMVVPGTGILMNNEMDDFSAAPGASNLFGAYGSAANKVEGRKRPLSSMSPTLIFKNGEPRYALGSPNGTRIISCVALTTLNLVEYGMSLKNAIAAPRYHHQWRPDELWVEPYFPTKTKDELAALGYKIQEKTWGCKVQGVSWSPGKLSAVADPRGSASALGL